MCRERHLYFLGSSLGPSHTEWARTSSTALAVPGKRSTNLHSPSCSFVRRREGISCANAAVLSPPGTCLLAATYSALQPRRSAGVSQDLEIDPGIGGCTTVYRRCLPLPGPKARSVRASKPRDRATLLQQHERGRECMAASSEYK